MWVIKLKATNKHVRKTNKLLETDNSMEVTRGKGDRRDSKE